jgi:hypothetical protein
VEDVHAQSFSGQIEGRVFTMVHDKDGNPNIELYIAGMKVEVRKKDAIADTVLAEGVTLDGGAFRLEFHDTDNASEIELYLNFIAENADGSIRVREKQGVIKTTRSETYRKSNPIIARANSYLSEAVGSIPLDNNATKPQLLHWANRSKQFVVAEASSSFTFPAGPNDTLDILTLPLGSPPDGAPFFFPGGYQSELIFALTTLYNISGFNAVVDLLPGLGGGLVFGPAVITSYINTEFSDRDAIYISESGSESGQLNENAVFHEFGHFLMWHLQYQSWLNPIDASFVTHSSYANSPNAKLSWTEGFANGFSMIVDAWSRMDDGEYGFDGKTAYEDRTVYTPETTVWKLDCSAGGGLTCNSQALSHGFVSEWYVGTSLYDLWDGKNNLEWNGEAVVPSDYDDAGQDNIELRFAEIIEPILTHAGTGGFHSLVNNQEQYLLHDFIQYHQALLGLTFTAPLDDLEECRIDRAITNVLHFNAMRNLHAALGTALFPPYLFKDFLNTDDLSFVREVETEVYKKLDVMTLEDKPDSTVIQRFTVDVTELHDSNDDFNYSSNSAGSFSGVLKDDLLVTGTPAGGSASLYFNNTLFYGWQSALNNFHMPIFPIATVENEFYVSLCGGMTLEAKEGGRIILGNEGETHAATVTLESGGLLILGGGYDGQVREPEYLPNGPLVSKGKLIIRGKSRLVIARGATLRINPGAEILLTGPDAVLEIRGNLDITANANFTYTSAGGGYVLFNLPDNGGPPNVGMGPSSKITLDEVPFKIAFDSYIRPEEKPGLTLTIRNGARGYLQNNAYINVSQTNFTMTESTIELDDGAASHKGIVLNGASHIIYKNTITGGAPGIYASKGSGNIGLAVASTEFMGCATGIEVVDLPTTLRNVHVSSCGTGLRTTRSRTTLVNTHFFNCGTGWWATDFTGPSRMSGGSARGNTDYGIRVKARAGSVLSLENLTIANVDVLTNEVGVWVEDPLMVKVLNSRFTNHLKSGMHLSNGAVLDMTAGAHNTFAHNPIGVQLYEAGELMLLNGQNEFYPHTLVLDGATIVGTLTPPLACMDPLFNPNIAAGGNTWYYDFNPATGMWLGRALAFGPYDLKTTDGCLYTLSP